jgi:multiple sugar transport system substrate-binding protein
MTRNWNRDLTRVSKRFKSKIVDRERGVPMKLFNRRMGGLLVLLALWGTGCSHFSNQPTIKISSWGDLKENAILSELINDFQKSHPGIRVDLERIPFDDYTTKILTEINGNLAPDVIFVEADNFINYCSRGILEPLDDYYKNDPDFPLKDFYPSLIHRFSVDGNLYVIPRDIAPMCLVYYNKKAFDEAHLAYPTDDWYWSELLADAKALTLRDKDGRTTRWGYVEDWPMVEPWVYSAGARWVDDPQKPTQYTFDNPVFTNAMQYRADLTLKYKVMPGPDNLTSMGGTGTSGMFDSGLAAMFVSGSWKIAQFRDIKNFDWDVAMFPKGPTGQRGFQLGGSGYGIMKSSKNKKLAWELVRYISEAEGEKKMAALGLAQPALRSVAESPDFLDGQKPLNKKLLLKAVDYGVCAPRAVNWRELQESVIMPISDRVWSGKITAAQAVSQMAESLKNKPLLLKFQETKNP